MNKFFLLLITVCFTSCTTTYYVVRHAEKAAPGPDMASDVPLSEAGQARAAALRALLENKKIREIYSTNTMRTRSTAKPLSDAIGVPVQVYAPGDTGFVNRVKSGSNGNVLIVGHSNTVDDIVNGFVNRNAIQDLPDTEYSKLFVVRKKGQRYNLTELRYGN
ncbi:MAG TPA: histidine phosphatase family protein [Flavisolibacter sp.]|nr:histidine phosphatase family protein [Flavisolibacter sp.]